MLFPFSKREHETSVKEILLDLTSQHSVELRTALARYEVALRNALES